MRLSASVIRILAFLGFFVFVSPALQAQGNFDSPEDPTNTPEDTVNSFGARIAGTYLVIHQPSEGPTRILNLFADGNITGMQSVQFGGDVPGEGFSNQHGTWKSVGENKIVATVLDLDYTPSTGEFVGTAIARYNLQFDNTLQTFTATAQGQVFSPGVDPLNPGDAEPFFEFSDNFQAKRVAVGN